MRRTPNHHQFLLCKVLMLPAKLSHLFKIDGVLHAHPDNSHPNKEDAVCKPQHIYFISSREIKEMKDHDLIIHNNSVKHFHSILNTTQKLIRIEATIDPSLGIALIPQSFIENFVKEEGQIYRAHIKIKRIPFDRNHKELVYSDIDITHSHYSSNAEIDAINNMASYFKDVVITDKNNTVIIAPPPD